MLDDNGYETREIEPDKWQIFDEEGVALDRTYETQGEADAFRRGLTRVTAIKSFE